MKGTYRVVGLGIVALASIALAQDSWTLKRTAKLGEAATYKVTADIESPALTGLVTMTVIEKVATIDPNGDYTVEAVSKDTKFKVGDLEQSAEGTDTSKSKYTAKGDLLSVDSAGQQANFRLSNLTAFRYPDKAVKVGDTWTVDIAADSKKQVAAAKLTYKVEGTEKIGSWDTLKIKTTCKESGVPEAADSDGFTWIEVSSGLMIKSESKWTNVPLNSGPVNAKITIVRQS